MGLSLLVLRRSLEEFLEMQSNFLFPDEIATLEASWVLQWQERSGEISRYMSTREWMNPGMFWNVQE